MKKPPVQTLRVYEYIYRHIGQYHYPPTLRELGDGCFMSHAAALRHVDRLEGMGWLQKLPNKARSIRLTDDAPDLAKLAEITAAPEPEPEEDPDLS